MCPQRNSDQPFSLDNSPSNTQFQTAARKRTPVIRIPLTDDGKLDTEKISPEMTEKVRQALGVEAPSVERPKIEFNRDYIPHAYSLLEVAIQQAGKFFLKWPPDLAVEMYFSPEKKAALVEPTAKVLEKYAPAWLVNNQDVAALGMALTDAVNDMVNAGAARYIVKKQAEILAKQTPPPVTQPTNGVEAK